MAIEMNLRLVHGLKQIVLLAAESQAEDCRRKNTILSDASVQRLHEDAGQAWRQRKTREALLHATVGAAVGSDAIERGRHHDDSYLRPCSLEALQECKRKIAVQVALVEFVEDNRVDALEGWVGQQATGEDALRDKSQTRTRPDPLFETDLVADRSANLFVEFPGDSSGRQACRDPARLEHDNFAADETENGRWNTGGLPRSRRRFNDQVGRMLQGRKKFRQNRVHWKCWLSTH